ncbi:hypothetical protein TrVE_jg6019 [Triparma verrucosa]|uniref:Uncharacterized protein n=1 Tax=Triparma verrucosa TaxID=1606542 RepID=A0A9W7FMV3_9STRA|nr:hypothetical protein TrVE_jg6019 [Triparma verrucosa]
MLARRRPTRIIAPEVGRLFSSGRRRRPPPNHRAPGGSSYTDFDGMFSKKATIPQPEKGEQRDPLHYKDGDGEGILGSGDWDSGGSGGNVGEGGDGDPLNFIRKVTKSALKGDIYTLPSGVGGGGGISPPSIMIYDELNRQREVTADGSRGDAGIADILLSSIGANGIALSPSHGDSSYSNPRMTFYVSVVPKTGRITYGSPVSGTSEFRFLEGRWRARDGTDLEGLIVRDMMRVFGGVLDMDLEDTN